MDSLVGILCDLEWLQALLDPEPVCRDNAWLADSHSLTLYSHAGNLVWVVTEHLTTVSAS